MHTMSDWTTTRKTAANRRRRVIFNNDGDDACLALEPTPESFLANRCIGLEDSHVDTISYCTCVSFDYYWHDSHIAQHFTGTHDFMFTRNHAQAFIDQGRDSLTLIIDFCRTNNLEVFWSARMNDVHDCWYPWLMPDFKKNHPELLLWRPGDAGRPGDGTVEPHMHATSVDYGRPEVRDRQFATIQDVCERYDIDGIELDFLRNPMYFRPNMEGKPAETSHLEIMTSFLRNIRQMTDTIGQARGKPMLISTRVPNKLSACRYIGLDVERWIEEDIIDLLIPSVEFACFTGDITEMVALGHSRNVPVYPCMSGEAMPYALPGWAGAATNIWANGADGIESYNEFNPKHPAWHVIGKNNTLMQTDKIYAVDNMSLSMIRMHEHVVDRKGRLPLCLETGKPTFVNLPVYDDLTHMQDTKYAILYIKLEGCSILDEILLTLNDKSLQPDVLSASEGLSPGATGTLVITSRVDPALVEFGKNTVGIQANEKHREKCNTTLIELRLHVPK